MTDSQDARLQEAEDRIAISELMTTYALAVDADEWDKVGNLWLEDGVYELDGIGTFTGPAGVKEMLTRPAHTFARENHGAHLLSYPVILLEGDRAVATTYGQILTREHNRHNVFRLIVTRWELRRTADGWRVARRINKLVDNAGDARALAGAADQWDWQAPPKPSDASKLPHRRTGLTAPTFMRNGATIAYSDSNAPEDRPDAQTIVFGHGMLFGGWMFRAQVAALSPDFRCVTIDWRGQGETPASLDDYDMDSLTEDVVALLGHLGVAPVHYVGLSMGGFVGMRLAARHPELVRSLTLLSTSAELDDEEGNVRSAQLAGLLWAFGTARVRETLEQMSFGPHFRAAPDSKAILDEWLARIDRSDGRGIASAIMGVIHREPVAAELSRIVAPTLVIHGEDDGMPVACGEAIASAIASAKFQALPGCGHACTLEKADEVTSLLTAFLAQH